MAILSSVGNHVELNSIDKNKKATTIFPLNTADDVLVDENGNSLTETLPQIRGDDFTVLGSLDDSEIEEIVIEDNTLISSLTKDEEESFDDLTPATEEE